MNRISSAIAPLIAPVGHPIALAAPLGPHVPLVVASPHSGRDYPPDFVARAALSAHALRLSEDCYVDDLLSDAPALGAPLLKALFPRAYLDPNREPYELDPDMFADPLPNHVNTESPRVAAGLGTIARIVACGTEIYSGKLNYAEAETRIRALYRPYHKALESLISKTRRRFGFCRLIDGHSMPSSGARDTQSVDFVLGDNFGASCDPAMTSAAADFLKDSGFRVAINRPYAGGFTTRHYGQPARNVHALQIEINRALYMNETTLEKAPSFDQLREVMKNLLAHLGALPDPAMQEAALS